MRTGLILLGFSCLATTVTANDLVDFLKKWGGNQRSYDDRQSQWDERQRDRYVPAPVVPQQPPPPPAIPFRLPTELALTSRECGLDAGRYEFDLYGNESMRLTVTGASGPQLLGGANPRLLLTEMTTLRPHVLTVVQAVQSVNDRDLVDAANDSSRELERTIRALNANDVADARRHHDHFTTDWNRCMARLSRYRVGPALQERLDTIERHEHRIDALFRDRGRFWDYDRPRLVGLSRVLSDRAAELEAAYSVNPTDWRSKSLGRQLGRVHFCADSFAAAVADDADFETLAEEYQIFDSAWHYVLDRTGRLDSYPTRLVAIGRDIWDIDSALAQVLLIDPPSVENSECANHVLDRFLSSCRRIDREFSLLNRRNRGLPGQTWRLIEQSTRLVTASETLERAIDSGRAFADCPGEFAELADAWKVLRRTVLQLPRTALPSGMTTLIASMSDDFNHLDQSFAGNYQWRYSSVSRVRP